MRVRKICAQNKVTKTITRTLCVLFVASALAQAKATDLIEALYPVVHLGPVSAVVNQPLFPGEVVETL